MNYKVEIVDGKYNVFVPEVDKYLLEGATEGEVKIMLAIQMEYMTKMDIIRLLMTFPHNFSTMDNKVIVHQDAVDEYESWYAETIQDETCVDTYHSLIDEKVKELLTS